MDYIAALSVLLICAIFARLTVYILQELVVKTSVFYYASRDPVLATAILSQHLDNGVNLFGVPNASSSSRTNYTNYSLSSSSGSGGSYSSGSTGSNGGGSGNSGRRRNTSRPAPTSRRRSGRSTNPIQPQIRPVGHPLRS